MARGKKGFRVERGKSSNESTTRENSATVWRLNEGCVSSAFKMQCILMRARREPKSGWDRKVSEVKHGERESKEEVLEWVSTAWGCACASIKFALSCDALQRATQPRGSPSVYNSIFKSSFFWVRHQNPKVRDNLEKQYNNNVKPIVNNSGNKRETRKEILTKNACLSGHALEMKIYRSFVREPISCPLKLGGP